MNVKTTNNKEKSSARQTTTWPRALLMAVFTLIFITLGAEATTISKTNNSAGFADDIVLDRSVTFVSNDFVTGSVVQDVNVAINFEKISGTCPVHDGSNYVYNREIYLFLESPDGTEVDLVTNGTYGGDAYGGLVAVTFDDWAAVTVGGPTPTSGTFKPVEALSTFQGKSPIGTWTLHVGDSAPGDPLCFYEFTLTIDATQPPVVNDQTFSVVEQSADGTAVGTVVATDGDAGDKLIYTITDGNSAGVFAINKLTGAITVADGSQLDYETTPSYTLEVTVTDSSDLVDTANITINITDANDVPTDISLDNSSVLEHVAVGTAVGSLSTADPDTSDSHTYILVAGTGDTDNASFQISGSQLQTNAVFNFEDKSSYTVRVQTNDGKGGTFSKVFTISITDGNDPPTDIALNSSSVAENEAIGTAVGNFSSTDPNSSDTHTYTLVSGTGSTDNSSFQIDAGELKTNAVFDSETKSSYSIRVRSTDNGIGSLWFEESFTITITDGNDAPTDIALDSSSVAENQVVGTAVGSFSSTDQDSSDTHTYTLVTGTGDTDNASFQISGNALQTNAVFDSETKASYSIRVRSTDNGAGNLWFEESFTITITDGNDAPTDISLSNSSVLEHQVVGTAVGSFSSTDQDSSDSHTYTLVAGTGDTDNASFQISGSQLQTNAVFNFEDKSSYTIRVQTNDGNSGIFAKQFTITITDGNDPPSDIALSNASVAENQVSGTAVGNFSSTDLNGSDTHTYTLVSGTGSTDNSSFQIDAGELQTNAVFDSETKASYSIRVRSTDNGAGNLWFEESFTITITDGNDAPTDIAMDSSSVAENQVVGTAVGSFSSTDQDSSDTHTYTLVAGTGDTGNASFQIVGSQLRTNAVFNREAQSSYSIRVQTDDGHSGTFAKAFTITISNVNEDPTDITLSSSSVNENQFSGAAVGNFSTTDPDSGDSFTYSLVVGAGADDNASFQISGSQLQTAAKFDFETKNTYSIRIQTSDSGSRTFEKAFTITINDINDAPVGVDDTDTIDEDHVLNVAADGVLGNDIDQDGDTLKVMNPGSTSSMRGAAVTLAEGGGFSYDPTAVTALQALNVGQSLPDTFAYMVIDEGILFSTATVTVTVTGVNDAPTANDDVAITVLETAVIVSPLANDTDPDTTDTKSLVSFGQGTHGTVTDNRDGTLTYTPEDGYIGSDSFSYTVEDSHGASDGATVNMTINPQIYYVYLPAALNNYTTAPDLVITSLQASSNYVEVVIENQGSQATTNGFWVDFYVNPTPPPMAANELWPELTNQGIAWGVTTSLAPGQALTLTYSLGGPNLYYFAEYSNFPGTLPVGTPVYAQVDSARVGSSNGAIEETHEILGAPYNNILQALATAVPASNTSINAPAGIAPAIDLPTRH